MGAAVLNIDGDQNGSITIPVQVQEADGTAADLTGYTGLMQVRPSIDSVEILAEGIVTIDPGTGRVTAVVDGDDTEDWAAGVYDIVIEHSSGNPREFIARGWIRLRPTVTRDTP